MERARSRSADIRERSSCSFGERVGAGGSCDSRRVYVSRMEEAAELDFAVAISDGLK